MLNVPPHGICVTLDNRIPVCALPRSSLSSGLAVKDSISSQCHCTVSETHIPEVLCNNDGEQRTYRNVTFIHPQSCGFVGSLDLNLHPTVIWINYVFFS